MAPQQETSSWWRLIQPFKDPMVIILLVAGLIFFALGEIRDGAIMLLAVIPVIAVDLVLEIRAERTLERLKELTAPRTSVRRGGREMNIPSEEVVVGDIILLKEGDVVPADAVVESESNLQTDESSLTGESLPLAKRGVGWPVSGLEEVERSARLFAGTTVVSGRATAVVTATGASTEYGQIGSLVSSTGQQLTPIQRTIGELVRNLGIIAVGASIAVAGLEIARGAGLTDAILAGVSLAIAAIPEEFSIVFAIYMTIGAWWMARRNALIRRLAGVETLGSTTVICTDKTGTLTEGRLSVGGLFTNGQIQLERPRVTNPALSKLLENALLASEPQPFDPLDQSIAALAKENGIEVSQFYSRWHMVEDYPFDSQRKYVTHVWRSTNGRLHVSSKGSIEGLLELSSSTKEEREALLEANQVMTGHGMRVIAIGEKSISRTSGLRWADEAGLKIVGLIGFTDPPREGVREAVGECQSAGVRVIMITGDHPLTAHAIAEAVGIYHEDGDILTGADVEQLDDDGLRRALGKVAIFARTLPAQKYRIVKGLKARGEVVAMTGDGINDAPALRVADIGVAMGRRGTEVAREAATMVLLDDNFGTIVEAIRQGRHIFETLRRAFLYLITFHIPIVLTALVIPLMGAPLLLLPIHLVWLELIVHPTAALVFESDPPAPDLMSRPPRNPREPIVSFPMGIAVAAEGAAILLGVIGVYFGFLSTGAGVEQARAAGVATLVIAQTILVLQIRSPNLPIWRRSVTDNMVLLPAILATLASLALMLYLGPLAAAAQLTPLSPIQWVVAVIVAAVATLGFEFRKRATSR